MMDEKTLTEIEARVAANYERAQNTLAKMSRAEIDRAALAVEVRRLRSALEGLVEINAEDFPPGPDGKIDWSAFPVTFAYAQKYQAALLALGREGPPLLFEVTLEVR